MMRLQRILSYSSLLVIAVALVIPLITLRSFPDYLRAWMSFFVILVPAYLLTALLFLFQQLSPTALTRVSALFLAFLLVGSIIGVFHLAFTLLFAVGSLVLNLVSRNHRGKSFSPETSK